MAAGSEGGGEAERGAVGVRAPTGAGRGWSDRRPRAEGRRDRARSDVHLSHGARKHITAVPLIGRVVLIHEEIDNRDRLAALTVAAVAVTMLVTMVQSVVVVVVLGMAAGRAAAAEMAERWQQQEEEKEE